MLLEVSVGVRIFLSRALVGRSVIVALIFVTTLNPKYCAQFEICVSEGFCHFVIARSVVFTIRDRLYIAVIQVTVCLLTSHTKILYCVQERARDNIFVVQTSTYMPKNNLKTWNFLQNPWLYAITAISVFCVHYTSSAAFIACILNCIQY